MTEKKKLKMDWSQDIYRRDEGKGDKVISFRVPKHYKDMIDKQGVSAKKLFMRSCEQLDNSLKSD